MTRPGRMFMAGAACLALDVIASGRFSPLAVLGVALMVAGVVVKVNQRRKA